MLSYNISLCPWNIVLWAPILRKAPREYEIGTKTNVGHVRILYLDISQQFGKFGI